MTNLEQNDLMKACHATCKMINGLGGCTCQNRGKGHYCESIADGWWRMFGLELPKSKIVALINGDATIRMQKRKKTI